MGMFAQRVVDWGMGNGLMQEENMATGNDTVTPEMASFARRCASTLSCEPHGRIKKCRCSI